MEANAYGLIGPGNRQSAWSYKGSSRPLLSRGRGWPVSLTLGGKRATPLEPLSKDIPEETASEGLATDTHPDRNVNMAGERRAGAGQRGNDAGEDALSRHGIHLIRDAG